MEKSINRRIITFFHSDSPLMSKRVRIILSNSEDSEILANAVREFKFNFNKSTSFKLSKATEERLKAEMTKVEN